MRLFGWFRRGTVPLSTCECGKEQHTISVLYGGRRLRYTLPALRAHTLIEQMENNPYPHPFDGIIFMDSFNILHTLHPENLKTWMINA